MRNNTDNFLSINSISWYLLSSTLYSKSSKSIFGNALTFLLFDIRQNKLCWWATMRFSFKMTNELHKKWHSHQSYQPSDINARSQICKKSGKKTLHKHNYQTFWIVQDLGMTNCQTAIWSFFQTFYKTRGRLYIICF